jgi:hypothetical protein
VTDHAPEGQTGGEWPPDASEEDLEGLRPGVEGMSHIIGPAVVREFRRAGGTLPTISRLASAIVGAMEDDPWLQELGENTITTEEALSVAHGIRVETRAVLNGGG